MLAEGRRGLKRSIWRGWGAIMRKGKLGAEEGIERGSKAG